MTSDAYDVVVVGAGPAGSMAARAAAARGLRVLLVDRRAEIGQPVQCAGYVPRLIRRLVPLPAACVAQETPALCTFLPGGRSIRLAAPGLVLHRARLDKHLAVEAVRAGADILMRTAALAHTPRGILACSREGEREIAAAVIVGADGPRSTVGRWIGQRNAHCLVAAQCELVTDSPVGETEVYLAPEYVQGYAWYFPKGPTAIVGAGLAGEPGDAARALASFLYRLQEVGRVRQMQVLARAGGVIPVGGLLKGWEGNIVLAGAAAGCVHPMTGAGILFALISGQLAGEAAALAVRTGRLEALADYERRREEAMGAVIAHGLAARRRLAAGWTADAGALERLLEETWIAGEGYGRW